MTVDIYYLPSRRSCDVVVKVVILGWLIKSGQLTSPICLIRVVVTWSYLVNKANKMVYKVIWIVHVFWLVYKCVFMHSAMKHENDVSSMVCCLQVVRIYSFMKEIKVYVRALYIVFLFVKTENINFIKEIRRVLRALLKTSAGSVRILQQVKTLDAIEFSQIFASVFTRQWRHGEHYLFSE